MKTTSLFMISLLTLSSCSSFKHERATVIAKAETLPKPFTRSKIISYFELNSEPKQSGIIGLESASCMETWKHRSGLQISASKLVWEDSPHKTSRSSYGEDTSTLRSASTWISKDSLDAVERNFPITTFDTFSVLHDEEILYSSSNREGEQVVGCNRR